MSVTLRYAWPTRTGRLPLKVLAALGAVALTLVPAARLSELDVRALLFSCADVVRFLKHFWVVPDWEYVPGLARKFWQTIEMTLLASCLSVGISLPLAVLGACNASPHPWVAVLVRLSLCLIRALPEMVWALVFVSALGLGAPAGVLALSIVSVGFMGRFYAESLEVVDPKVTEAVTSQGAGWFQVRLYGILPQAMPDMVGSTLYLLDHNLRAATLLGLVGAGGIGYDMIVTLKLFRFDRLLLIIVAVYLAIFMLDRLSDLIRRRIM